MTSKELHKLQCGFVTGWDSWRRNLRIRLKYAIMRAGGIFYPDVYAIRWLGGTCIYIGNGAKIDPKKFALTFAELTSSDAQVEYLLHVVEGFRK